MVLCKKYGLNHDDLEVMTIGMCLDYISEYLDMHKPEKEKVRKARQNDFDSF